MSKTLDKNQPPLTQPQKELFKFQEGKRVIETEKDSAAEDLPPIYAVSVRDVVDDGNEDSKDWLFFSPVLSSQKSTYEKPEIIEKGMRDDCNVCLFAIRSSR